ncbi:MAG: PspA/IM30 family protein [Proteobacteria bacterium]|nr:PspA/IM30 family protein [Pseudomonadota bacterium]
MGLFERMKRSAKAKANATIDKMRDPEKELELAITELDDMRKKAIEELVAYKATAKKMEQDLEREEKRAEEWEKRAKAAVVAGDDELAKKALRERQNSLEEIAKIKRDRDEAASYAIQLNKSRKTAESKLRMLKLRKGTLATQLQAARSGSSLGVDSELFDKFAEAEDRIGDEAIEAEVQAALDGELTSKDGLSADEFDRKLLEAGGDPTAAGTGKADSTAPNDPLAALKAKMAAQKKPAK